MNLASLLNKPAEEVRRPVALPEGTYYGTVKTHEFITSSQKKTPGVEYTLALTHAHEDVDLSEFQSAGGALEDKTLKTTFWLSENALFMLTDFIASTGIEAAGRTLGELIPQPVGQPVILDVSCDPNKQGDGYHNKVRRVTGANSQS